MYQVDVFQLKCVGERVSTSVGNRADGCSMPAIKFGSAFCQEVQYTYLKRQAHVEWSSMFYYQGRACQVERFEGNDILFKL